jgi:DNA polymerase I-like protein with 3'-5' exonuclease and polymerase domains
VSDWFKVNNKGAVWTSAEFTEYVELLKKELLSLTNITTVVPLGNVALYALAGLTQITKRRGSILESTLIPGLKCIPTIHPAAADREHLFTYYIKHDLALILEESKRKEIVLPERHIVVGPSYYDVIDFLIRAESATEIGNDIEVMNEEISCISLSISPWDGISIPFVVDGHDYFTPDQELNIWRLLARILSNPDIKKVGQNYIFDMSFIFRKYGIIIRNYDCTMIAQGIAYPDFPKGLDFITSIFTNEPYYKDDGKKWFKTGGSYQKFWIYNAKDSLVCQEAFPKLVNTLKKQDNYETYEYQRDLIHPLMYMQARGMRMDVDGLRNLSKEAEVKMTEKLLDLSKLVEQDTSLKIESEPDVYKVTNRSLGTVDILSKSEFERAKKQRPVLNMGSSQQLAELFYTKLGHKPYLNKGSITTNDDALKRLVRKGVKEAFIIRDVRKIAKLKGTYYDMKLSADGRLRSAMNPIGAVSGRLSSSQDIFGEGGNVQNLPPVFQQFVLADDGYVMYIPDLSQAENRTTANIAPEPLMLQAFKDANEIKRQDKEDIYCNLGTGEYTWRFWGKKCKLSTCEVLTYGGWISIESAYLLDADIAQWNTDGNISFVKPTDWFVENYTGDIHVIENQRIFQQATPEHKMPLFYKNRDINRIVDKPISDYPSSGHHFSPLSGTYSSGEITLSPYLIRLIVAFQADGNWNGNSITIRVTKQRKIDRLKYILDSYIPYSDTESGVHISSRRDEVKLILALLGKQKLFGSWLLSLSQESLNVFLDELPHWDGYKDTLYFTTVKSNAEWVQTVAHLCNKASLIHEQDNSKTDAYGDKIVYRVSIRDTIAPSTAAINKHKYRVIDEKIFCPTVPSGYFMCREGGRVSVTGNCNHSLNYDLGYKSFALRFEMPETQAKQLVDRFHKVYPGIRQYHAWVRALLSQGMTLTNCFGRKRIFMNKWGDELFKEAYSWIPQSSIADKVNRQGILFIWNNPQLFYFLELLNQIHDSLVFQIPVSIGWEKHAEMLINIKKSLEKPMIWHGKEFTIPLEFKFGHNMKDTKKVGIDNDETVGRLANKLHEIYGELGASRQLPSVDRDLNDSSNFTEEMLT